MDRIEGNYGPKMSALTDRQRAFVEHLFDHGLRNATKAAELAGYAATSYGSLKVQGHRLLHDARIQDAIHEHAQRAFKGHIPASIATLAEIRDSSTATPGERLNAAKEILNRAGMAGVTEHKTTVEHIGQDPEQLNRITTLAAALGISAGDALKAFLGKRAALEAPTIEAMPILPALPVINPDEY